MRTSLLNFPLKRASCKTGDQWEKMKTKFNGRLLLLFLGLLMMGNSIKAQVTIGTSITTTNGTVSVLSGQSYTVQVNYSVSSLTGSATGLQAIIDLPDNIYGIANYVGTADAPVANFVVTNVGGDRKLVINFVSPILSGSSGVLQFDIITQNLTTPDGTVLTTTAVIKDGAGNTSPTVTNTVTVNATPSLCARKSLLSGGAVGYPTTYRVHLSADGGYTYAYIAAGLLQPTNITITDVLPADATFISAKVYNSNGTYLYDGTYNSGTVTATMPNILPSRNTNASSGWSSLSSYMDITVQYDNPPFSTGQTITNNASVQFTPLGGSPTTLNNGSQVGSCTSDLIEATTLVAPVVSATISKSASTTIIYPGQSFNYSLGFNNTSNIPLQNLEIIEDIPSQLRIDITAPYNGVRIDGSAWAYLDHLEYQTSNTATWIAMSSYPAVPYNLPTVPPDGGYITKIKYVFKPSFPANTAWPSSGYVLLYFKAIEVATPTTITNCITWNSSTSGIPVNRTGCSTITENPRPTTSKINYSITSDNVCAGSIGSQNTFTGTVSADAGFANAENPMIAMFIPSGLQYVPGSEIFSVGTSAISGTPTLQILPNYITIGGIVHDMYRWTFPGGTVLPYGTYFKVSVKVTATNLLIPGTAYTGSFIATASNASVNAPDYSYGNITDTNDWDMDGNTTEIFARANSNYGHCALVVSPSASLQSTKLVKGQLDAGYSQYPDVATTVPGGNADYKLIVTNPGNVVMKNITLIDILPYVGDRGVIDPSNRLSEWRPNLAGPISAPTGITVYYSTEANPCRDEVKSPSDPTPYPTGCVVPGWSTVPPSDLTKVQSVKIDFGAITLAGGDSLVFSWPMRAPFNSLPGDTAWNSFAFTATRNDNNLPLLSAEPIKVGIQVEAGSPAFYGDRVWYDTNHNGIQDEGEGGVDGVIVKLFTPTVSGVRNPDTDQLVNFTITGNGGQYLFSNLPAGDYYAVFITPAGYSVSPDNAGSNTAINSDGTVITYNSLPATITPITNIAANETDLTWDQGIYCGITPSVTPPKAVFYTTTVTLTATGGTAYLWSGPNGFTANTASITLTNIQAQDMGNYYVTISDGPCAATLTTQLSLSLLSALGDRVWKDDNQNGIQDAGEPGVAGVTVTLYNAAGAVAGTTVTDAYGNYLFTNLTPGVYSVRFTLPANYTFTQQISAGDNGNNTNSDANPVTGRSGTFTLSASEMDITADAGLVFNTPITTATIGDKVWLDSDANGIQNSGEPGVAGVTVTLYKNGIAVGTTITDANGNYLFTNVPAGSNYTVGFSLPPAFVFTTNDQGGNDNTDSDVNPTIGTTGFGQTPSFTVTAGVSNLTLDAGIMPQPVNTASLGDFVWNDLNRNGIQDAGEPGIAGVVVNLLDASGNPVLVGLNPVTTVTDAFGHYQFNNLTAGSYIVQFIAPAGYTISPQHVVGSNVTNDNNASPSTGRTAIINLSAGNRITTIDAGMYNNSITPGTTATIGDKVWLDTNSDGIQTSGEPGVAGVTVTLYNTSGTAIAATSTDVNGNYSFVNVAPGTYSVGFSNLPSGTSFTTANTGGNDAVDSDANPVTGITTAITVVAGQSYTDLDAGLVQGVPAGLGSIGNQVWYDLNNNGFQDAGELGVSNVTVTLKTPGIDGIAGNGDDVTVATTTTNALGQYLFGGLTAGSYYVAFSTLPSGYNVSPQNAGTNDAIDSDGGAVSSGVSVTGIYSLATGQDNLTIDLGIYNSSGTNNNTIGNFVWLDANGDGLQTEGEPGIPGVQVTLFNASGIPVSTTTTDANGQYQFTGVADGTYSVGFSNLPAGFTFTTQTANTANGSDANTSTGTTGTITVAGNTVNNDLDAGLVSTKAVLGNYVWNDTNGNGIQNAGEPGISGVTVTLYASDGTTVISSAITDANGQYLFTNLDPGTYVVGFSTLPSNMVFTTKDASGSTIATGSDANITTGKTDPIALVAGQVNLNVDAGVKTLLLGTVGNYVWIDANGDGLQDTDKLLEPGVPGVIATLYNYSNVIIGSAVTDGTGHYLITGVPEGSGYYIVFSNKPGTSLFTPLQNVGNMDADNNSNANAIGRTNSFNVSAGQNITEVDAGITGWAAGSTLPVTLENFNGQVINCDKVQLSWKVSNAVNFSHFEIEEKKEGGEFKTIGLVFDGAGITDYSFKTSVSENATYQYRLKLIDIDGKFEYSNTVRLIVNCNNGGIRLYPTITTSTVQLFGLDKAQKIELFTSAGQLVHSVKVLNNSETLDVSKFHSGLYIVVVSDSNGQKVFSTKIVKQ